MFAKLTKLQTRTVVSLLIMLILVTAYLIKSAGAFRNQSNVLSQRNMPLRKLELDSAQPSKSSTGGEAIVAEVGSVPSTRGPQYLLSFVDDQHGWFADDLNLWRTTDGGQTWNLLLSNDHILNIFFSNREVGWLERMSGIYRSENGGKTWTRVLTSLDYPEGMIGGMYFLKDGQTGWILGGTYKTVSATRFHEDRQPSYLVRDGSETGRYAFLYQRILKTNDGGNTWRKQSLPEEVGEIFKLNVVDNMRGVALAGNQVFFTDNGGTSWRRAFFKAECVDPQFIKFPDSRPRAVAFAGSSAWLSYDNGRVLKSIDGAETWCDLLKSEEVWQPGEQGGFFRQLYFTDSLKGWGLKDNGKLYRTDDGGRVWSPVELKDTTISSVEFFEHHALLVTRERILKMRY